MKKTEEKMKDMLMQMLAGNVGNKLEENLKDVWELQEQLRELEKEIIRGNVASVEMEVKIKVGKIEERFEKEDE